MTLNDLTKQYGRPTTEMTDSEDDMLMQRHSIAVQQFVALSISAGKEKEIPDWVREDYTDELFDAKGFPILGALCNGPVRLRE